MAGFKKVFNDADLKREKNRIYGKYKGYYVKAEYGKTAAGSLDVSVAYANGEEGVAERIKTVVERAVSTEKKPPVVQVLEHNVVISNPGTYPLKKLAQFTENYIQIIINALIAENCTSGCEVCGLDEEVSYYDINGNLCVHCSICANKVVNALEANKQEVRSDKSNVVLGIVGAFLGCLLGVALWVVIRMLGYIAAVAGAAMIVLAMSGYRKFGKALDVKGVIVSFIISVLMIFVANQLSWSLMFAIELGKSGLDISFFDINRDILAFMDEAGIMGDFIGELVTGYLLFVVAGISYAVQAFKEARGNYKIKKL